MPIPGEGKRIVESGTFANVAVHTEDGRMQIALVQSYNSSIDYALMEVKAMGYLGAIDFQATDYRGTLSFTAYLPINLEDGTAVPFLDGGRATFKKYLKLRSQIQLNGRATFFKQIDIYDSATNDILHSFQYCLVSSISDQGGAGQLSTGQVQLRFVNKLK